MRRELKAVSASVPDTASVSPFIDELTAIAASTGMQVSSFTASDATAYSPSITEGSDGQPADDATAEPSSATNASTAPAAPAAPGVVTDASITGQNLSVIPVTVAVDGTFDQALHFVEGVQKGQRLFLITTISSTGKSGDDGASSASSTWTFGGSIYVLDRSSGAAAAQPSATPSNG
ncbi:hypothetical protein P9139_01735 [Curtobacterium flaccumfaciens]|nr:hypothetical protein P9139_01735 [Curtobacterium flaccumfaciens]